MPHRQSSLQQAFVAKRLQIGRVQFQAHATTVLVLPPLACDQSHLENKPLHPPQRDRHSPLTNAEPALQILPRKQEPVPSLPDVVPERQFHRPTQEKPHSKRAFPTTLLAFCAGFELLPDSRRCSASRDRRRQTHL